MRGAFGSISTHQGHVCVGVRPCFDVLVLRAITRGGSSFLISKYANLGYISTGCVVSPKFLGFWELLGGLANGHVYQFLDVLVPISSHRMRPFYLPKSRNRTTARKVEIANESLQNLRSICLPILQKCDIAEGLDQEGSGILGESEDLRQSVSRQIVRILEDLYFATLSCRFFLARLGISAVGLVKLCGKKFQKSEKV